MDTYTFILLASRSLLAYIFLSAGWTKTRHSYHFVREVEEYQLLPTFLVKPFAITLPYIEIVLGMMLAIGWWIKVVAIAMACLQLMFISAMTANLIRGRTPNCGCSGGRVHKQISLRLVGRDLGLLFLSIAIAIQGTGFLAFDALPDAVKKILLLDWFLPLIVIASGIYLVYMLYKQLVRFLSLKNS